jgi:hypothetical protein
VSLSDYLAHRGGENRAGRSEDSGRDRESA